jgi:hypothetical protein
MASKEESQNMVSKGSAFKPQNNYTKADFLLPNQVAKKFNISTEEARNLMKSLMFRNALFALNGRKTPIIVNLGKHGSMYLHPMAMEAFQQQLDKQKG